MSVVITAHDVGKSFPVITPSSPAMFGYRSLRDDLTSLAKLPLRMFKRAEPVEPRDTFWALKDINFEISQGDVVAIIGANGAGKSTLLKLLSSITRPTTGHIRMRGRVGCLLEVGSGFHPELTGRENVYLNGAILGMRRHEIAKKFDQIVEFAEIDRFLDMPVKRYSSGMYVRLAFAVAAHLEPEILIVDEVLAVGDLAFQRKCLGRMQEVGRSGATVFLVSHNMSAVESLCTRALYLEKGRLVAQGEVADLVQMYHRRTLATQDDETTDLAAIESPARMHKVFRSATLLDAAGEPTNFVALGERFHLRLEVDSPVRLRSPEFMIGIEDASATRLLTLVTPHRNPLLEAFEGRGVLDCVVDHFPLAPGDYYVHLLLYAAPDEIDELTRVKRFTVTDGEAFGEGHGCPTGKHRGICIAPSHWQFEPAEEPARAQTAAC